MTRTPFHGDPGRKRSPEPSSVGDVVAGLMRERFLAGGMQIGRLARRWPDVVGDRLAAETAPVRLEGGILIVAATDGPWGAQARFLAEEIRRQANEALGGEVVRRVQVVVDPGRQDAPKPL
ncbi:MAG: DUF721 domain-containing protein [Actinomycetota bacterium]|nr:DUF721 domain-containing protein [Actinomycetota bacterium]